MFIKKYFGRLLHVSPLEDLASFECRKLQEFDELRKDHTFKETLAFMKKYELTRRCFF